MQPLTTLRMGTNTVEVHDCGRKESNCQPTPPIRVYIQIACCITSRIRLIAAGPIPSISFRLASVACHKS